MMVRAPEHNANINFHTSWKKKMKSSNEHLDLLNQVKENAKGVNVLMTCVGESAVENGIDPGLIKVILNDATKKAATKFRIKKSKPKKIKTVKPSAPNKPSDMTKEESIEESGESEVMLNDGP